METIVEAIRHLEGDHLFSDDRTSKSSSSDSPSRPMEICQSPEGSPTHSEQSQAMNEMPLTYMGTPSCLSRTANMNQLPNNATATTSASTTVTSLKHHVLNRIARTSDAEEQPMNLEFRPASRSPSPPFAPIHPVQMQQRPGVIVVKTTSF